jgi:hypothetical protein
MIDLDTPIGFRFTTDPIALRYGTRAGCDAALALFFASAPVVVAPWGELLALEDQIWARMGWYRGVHVRIDRCIEVNGVWRSLTQSERDTLTVLSRKKFLSSKK